MSGETKVTQAMRSKGLLAGLVILVAGLLAYAWIDGGREPMRDIAVSVPVPELAR